MKNTFGSDLSLTIFGESHGRAVGKLDAGGGIRVIVGSVAAMPMAYSASGNLWLVLLVTILIGAVYFVLTSWLMKNKLDLE